MLLTGKLNRIEKYSRKYRNIKLEKYGLKRSDHSYILFLKHHPGASQEELTEMIALDKANVARHLSRLEEQGLIERRQSKTDRRITEVFLSPKGEELYPIMRDVAEKWSAYLLEDLSEEQRKMFNDILDQMILKAKNYPFEGEENI